MLLLSVAAVAKGLRHQLSLHGIIAWNSKTVSELTYTGNLSLYDQKNIRGELFEQKSYCNFKLCDFRTP